MISDVIKQNWAEMAMRAWEHDYFADETTVKPDKSTLAGIINVMLNTNIIVNGTQHVSKIKIVEERGFFHSGSQEIILGFIDDGLRAQAAKKRMACKALQSAYKEGFDTNEIIKPLDRTSPRAYNLVDKWTKAAFKVLHDEFPDQKALVTADNVKDIIEGHISELKKSFGEFSYRKFVTDDEIMDETDRLLEVSLNEAVGDENRLAVIKAMQIAVTRLPEP